MAENFGVEDRGRFYDAVGTLRDVVVNHLVQLIAATAMEEPARGRSLDDAKHRLLRAVAAADPARYVRGQYAGYLATPGVAARSTTETFVALELRIDNERWRGVPFYVRAGKYLPVRQTEVRLVFRDQPPLRFLTGANRPRANELVVRIDPVTGIQVVLEAHRADAQGPEPITLDMQFADGGRRRPDPVRDALRGGSRGRPLALHPTGHRRAELAHRAAAARLSAAGRDLPARHAGGRPPRASCSRATTRGASPGCRRDELSGAGGV